MSYKLSYWKVEYWKVKKRSIEGGDGLSLIYTLEQAWNLDGLILKYNLMEG